MREPANLRTVTVVVLAVFLGCSGGGGGSVSDIARSDTEESISGFDLHDDRGDLEDVAALELLPDTQAEDLTFEETGSDFAPEFTDACLACDLDSEPLDVDGDLCVAACEGRVCGSDGCGGTCGECLLGQDCSEDGTCTNRPAPCEAPKLLNCGDSVAGDTLLHGGMDFESYVGCSAVLASGPEEVYGLTVQQESHVTVVMTPEAADLDLFHLDGACDAFHCADYSDGTSAETLTFDLLPEDTAYLVVDGFHLAAGAYTLTVECVDPCHPQCDGRQCGDDQCGGLCGTCALGYQCGVEGTCDLIPQVCGEPSELHCSQTLSETTAGASAQVSFYLDCVTWPEHGPEKAYRFVPEVSGVVHVLLTPEDGLDLDLFLLNETCDGGACVAASADFYEEELYFQAEAGAVFYLVVDGFLDSSGPFDLLVECGGDCLPDCSGKTCGDDGCGGSCGGCPPGQLCSASGACVVEGGATTCGEINSCVVLCSSQDTACKEGCVSSAAEEAVVLWAALALCTQEQCGTEPSSACLAQALTGACSAHFQACVSQ